MIQITEAKELYIIVDFGYQDKKEFVEKPQKRR